MKSSLRTRSTRMFAIGALSAALLTAGTAGAFAAEPNPNPKAPKATHMSEPKATLKPNPKMDHRTATITTRVNRPEVMLGQRVTFTGRTDGLKIGSPVVLERYVGGKWTPLTNDIRTTINQRSNYTLAARLDYKGQGQYRVRAGDVVSQPVYVTVK